MASGRRASMREGPLAALFRRTEDDGAPSTDAVAAEQAAEAAAAAEQVAKPAAPHPSLLSTDAPAAEPDVAVPSPQERLRAAFSSDIPENILEPVTMPSRHIHARDDDEAVRRPGMGPVLRVVGVGGAGVNAVNRMIE